MNLSYSGFRGELEVPKHLLDLSGNHFVLHSSSEYLGRSHGSIGAPPFYNHARGVVAVAIADRLARIFEQPQ